MYKRRTYLATVARAETNASESNRDRAFQACKSLKALGIKATVDYAFRRTAQGRFTGLVTLDPAAFLSALGITEELPPIQEPVTEV